MEKDAEMRDPREILEDESEDGSPKTNQDVDDPDNEEGDDQSMFNFDEEPLKDGDEDRNDAGDEERIVQEDQQTLEQPKSNPKDDTASKVSKPSTDTTISLSPAELEALKRSNPLEYMKAIISVRSSSLEKSPSTSTMSGGPTTSQSKSEVLQKLMEKAFEVDLIQILENDTFTSFGIKYLLKQIDLVHASSEIADLVMDLGLLIDYVVADLGRIREASNKIQSKSETQTAKWKVASESIAKSADLEKTSEKNKKEIEACDKNIRAWEQRIKEL